MLAQRNQTIELAKALKGARKIILIPGNGGNLLISASILIIRWKYYGLPMVNKDYRNLLIGISGLKIKWNQNTTLKLCSQIFLIQW